MNVEITEAEIDAGAKALRECMEGYRKFYVLEWGQLPNSRKRKWRDYAAVVLAAAAEVNPN